MNLRYLVIGFTILLFYSCGVKKGVRYFEDIENIDVPFNEAQTQLEYQPNDLINIRISSKDNVAVAPFNLTETSFVSEDGIGETAVTTRPYLVKPDGTITMPTLGTVVVAGKNKEQLTEDLIKMLVPQYLKDPMIDIELINFRFSVIGDVEKPGVYTVESERVTIIEAIALAGDMSISGLRDNVKVLREEDGQRRFIRVNFLEDSIFQSPAYFLKQNDVIYVEQNALKTREIAWESRIPFYTSLLTVAITIYVLVTR